jgi:UDP-glucose:glycoprotein glucosyltransferase
VSSIQEATIQGGVNGVFLNGKAVTFKEFQPIGLLPLLRSERAIISSLTALNLSTSDAVDLLTTPAIVQAYSAEESKVDLFDASDRIERNSVKGQPEEGTGVITYWNDLEKGDDPRYARWSTELRSILRPMYPGSFPVIRRNLFNIVMITDMQNVDSCTFIADTVALATSKLAIRWGIVPSNLKDEGGASLQLARFLWLAVDEGGVEIASKYLRRVVGLSTEKIKVETAEKELQKILHLSSAEIEELLPRYSKRESLTRRYLQRLRADDDSPGHVFVNGQYIPFGPQTFQFIHQAVATQVQMVAAPIYYGQLQEDDEVSTYFYDLPGTHLSRSELLFPSEDSAVKTKVVELSEASIAGSKYITPSDVEVNSTVWIAGNLDSREGAQLLRDVIQALANSAARLGLIHIKQESSSKESSMLLSTFLYQLLTSSATITPEQLLEVLDTYQGEHDNLHEATMDGQTVLEDAIGSINRMKAQGWSAPQTQEAAQYWEQVELKKTLDLNEGDYALVVNGKVISKFKPLDLSSADYEAYLQKESTKVNAVVQVLSNMTSINADLSTRAAAVLEKAYFVDSSLEGIFEATSTTRSRAIDNINFQETAFTIGDKDTASLRFSVLLDSLSETAQLWSSVIEMLSGFDDVFIKVMLNPTPVLTELPIKRYYRHSAPSKLAFDAQGQIKPVSLCFADMPLDAVLTMGLDAPPSWLTMAADAIYDLDNIRLKDVVTPSVSVVYDLKYILIEGHARDESKGAPRGLQIVLETMDGSQQLDTIVMANLAYFQFRAKPGLYRLRLRQGRSSELYDMVSVGNAGFDSPPVEVTGQSITLSTLQGLTIYPRLARKKGKEREILVEEESPDGTVKHAVEEIASGNLLSKAKGLLQSVTSKTSSSSNGETDVQRQATINVFTVASGHLYERMTYIMILSVLKHTTSTVKFWFIENFLSPSFKDFIPHLAQEYGFDYELITYAWPHWLRAQKEKQREIWGMKVLFLDVIFPLSLSKVIFVDADQIVRADLKELIDKNLHGAPYGFPPMGNDSYDMDNFRFWEQKGGYWENFLRGKPYPISALFVVDLNKFRLQAAGDKLRGNYQALTQDPNSLSNLDQDLVASMIHVVEIHSLEKEWLWCETWCSWDWHDRAKSIDLCSNPKTKEPKLDRAKRQIPEWTKYDDEVARAAIKFKEQGKLGANVVAPVKVEGRKEERHAKPHDEL